MAVVTLKIMPDDAQTVVDGWQVHRQRDFRGGETQALLPEAVGRNQLLRMENVLLFTTGYLSAFFQMDTQAIVGADPGVCLMLLYGGIYNFHYAPGDGNVYSGFFDSSLGGAVNVATGTPTPVAGAYISGVNRAVEFLGKHYVCNPNPDNTKNGILNVDDYVLTTIPGKTARYLRKYMNRLWVVNTNGTIQISNNGDAATWDPLNILWLPNQEPAIDFIPVQGGAIVYGANSVYAMYGASYLDIDFVPLASGKEFGSGAVEVNGTVYVLSTEGIYAVTLNGANLLQHNQQDYFQSIFPVLAIYPKSVVGVHLQKFRAIMFSWPVANGGQQSLMHYYLTNGYSKANILLPSDYPYAMALNDVNTDFLIGLSRGVLAKSMYPSNNLLYPKLSVIQTRHEDADSSRQKTWEHFGIRVHYTVFGATIEAILDYNDNQPIVIASNVVLSAGENIFMLNSAEGLADDANFPNSETISIRISFSNSDVVTTHLANESTGARLTNENNGNQLVFDSMPGNFLVQELKLKYCLAGPDI